MTQEQKDKTMGFLAARQWTDFLLSLPVDKTLSWTFDNFRMMESCRQSGWRLNARNECGRRFIFTSNYRQKALTIEVRPCEKDNP